MEQPIAKLYSKLLSYSSKHANVECCKVFSPLCVFNSIYFLHLAAGDTFAKQLSKVIGIAAYDSQYDAKAVLDEITLEPTSSAVKLFINYFVRNDKLLNQIFVDKATRYFSTSPLLFDASSAVDMKSKLDAMISQATNGLITDSRARINADTSCGFLTTAMFTGKWLKKFEHTYTGTFRNNCNEIESNVAMMEIDGCKLLIAYSKCGKYRLLEIPYENDFTLSVITRNEDMRENEIQEIADAIVADDKFLSKFYGKSYRVEFHFPKLDYNSNIDVSDFLADAIGEPLAFDLSKMINGPFVGDSFEHSAAISFNESGTEAAAVTSMTVCDGMIPTVKVNRPFVYFITKKSLSKVPIFGGYVGSVIQKGLRKDIVLM